MERNAQLVQPQRIKEFSEKIEQLNDVLKSKDDAIEQLLCEIAKAKAEKDQV